MNGMLTWFVQMVVCSAILYANYHILLRNNKFHSYNRYYLLAALVLSILVPCLHIPVEFTTRQNKPAILWQTLAAISPTTENEHIQIRPPNVSSFFITENVLILLYVAATLIIFARFLTAIVSIGKLLTKYKAEWTGNIYFVNTADPTTPFSFFKWLFWNNKIDLQSQNGQQIFRHELFHIRQRHSWDRTFVELTTAVFWINPFFHLIKKEVKTIHEFLADEFATTENDKWNYAELLLIRVLDSSAHRLVNPFFHNQIKRRIAMITSSKKPKHQFFRKLMILPTAAVLIALFSFKIRTYSGKAFLEPIAHPPVTNVSDVPKILEFGSYLARLDTIKPKENQKTKKAYNQNDIDQKKNEAESAELQKLIEGKTREAQESQEMLKKLMTETQTEIEKHQEEFKKMMEMSQKEAQQNGEKLRLMLEKGQKETAKYQEEFKKMLQEKNLEAQKEGEEKFKQLMEERQKEAEKSQIELKKLLQERQMQIEQWQEDFKKKMMLIQEEKEKTKKQVS